MHQSIHPSIYPTYPNVCYVLVLIHRVMTVCQAIKPRCWRTAFHRGTLRAQNGTTTSLRAHGIHSQWCIPQEKWVMVVNCGTLDAISLSLMSHVGCIRKVASDVHQHPVTSTSRLALAWRCPGRGRYLAALNLGWNWTSCCWWFSSHNMS